MAIFIRGFLRKCAATSEIREIHAQILPFASFPAILRPMSRPLRIDFPGAIYHVTFRSNRREPIFEDDSDRPALLSVMEEEIQHFDAQVLAY